MLTDDMELGLLIKSLGDSLGLKLSLSVSVSVLFSQVGVAHYLLDFRSLDTCDSRH